jgi:hypothetical protein
MKQCQVFAALAEYARAVAVAVLTLVASGHFEPRTMVIGAAAALLPLVARGANPNDPDFGYRKDDNS